MSDKIITRPATDEYRDGYDRIFCEKDQNSVEYRVIDVASMSEEQSKTLSELFGNRDVW